MNKPVELPTAVTGKQKMTPSEAFVETLVANGVKDVFGIVGSAYMDALDLFPLAGIRFISVAHEQGGGHMADGYARVSGPARRLHRAERPRHHQFRHVDRGRVLGALAGRRHHAGNGQRARSASAASRRPSSCRSSRRSRSTRRTSTTAPGWPSSPRRAFDRAHPGARADAAQHSARFLLRRHRVRDPATDRRSSAARAASRASMRRPTCSRARSFR